MLWVSLGTLGGVVRGHSLQWVWVSEVVWAPGMGSLQGALEVTSPHSQLPVLAATIQDFQWELITTDSPEVSGCSVLLMALRLPVVNPVLQTTLTSACVSVRAMSPGSGYRQIGTGQGEKSSL